MLDGDKHQGENQDRRMGSAEGGAVLEMCSGKAMLTDWKVRRWERVGVV